jgi:hypothetical protein
MANLVTDCVRGGLVIKGDSFDDWSGPGSLIIRRARRGYRARSQAQA